VGSKYSKKASSREKRAPASKAASKVDKETFRTGRAPEHGELIDRRVHVFVDDQNLFYGITNHQKGKDFRIDFGLMLAEVCRDTHGNVRPVDTAYIAGVIPDDDSFWKAAESKGFTVKRGYLGSGNRSKQDDAFLIAEIVETVWSQKGPATIVLVAGDADYVPALMKALAKGWRTEVAFIDRGISISLEPQVHEFRTLNAGNFELIRR
jgi:uncharacterized LabA/DUF88 family protein